MSTHQKIVNNQYNEDITINGANYIVTTSATEVNEEMNMRQAIEEEIFSALSLDLTIFSTAEKE